MKISDLTRLPAMFQVRSLPLRRRPAWVAGIIGLGVMASLGMVAGPSAARAQQPWESGCAYRMPSGIPGVGTVILSNYCQRLRFCQAMADRGSPNLALMGRFGFDARRQR